MGWIVSIVLAAGAIGWLYAQMRPNDMESVIRRLPEDERRKLIATSRRSIVTSPSRETPRTVNLAFRGVCSTGRAWMAGCGRIGSTRRKPTPGDRSRLAASISAG